MERILKTDLPQTLFAYPPSYVLEKIPLFDSSIFSVLRANVILMNRKKKKITNRLKTESAPERPTLLELSQQISIHFSYFLPDPDPPNSFSFTLLLTVKALFMNKADMGLVLTDLFNPQSYCFLQPRAFLVFEQKKFRANKSNSTLS